MASRLAPVAGLPALKVQYYRRMKKSRVYPVTIGWSGLPNPTGSLKNVTVRLLGAGAQIVPSEQALDVTRPDLKAVFFVTPLAMGWLRAQRVEVLLQGRKVQEIPLASKVVCQCWSAFWFILAWLLPALLIWWRGADPQWLSDAIRHNVPSLPAVIADNIPALNDFWNGLCTWKGELYAWFCRYNQQKMLAFPLGIGLLFVSLAFLIANRDRMASRTGQPIVLPPGQAEE
jgi:hypothetical protein